MPSNVASSAVENRLEEFRNITTEIEALKGRIRRLISNKHFPTDGEWKESVVRTMLRRYVIAHFQADNDYSDKCDNDAVGGGLRQQCMIAENAQISNQSCAQC